MPLGFRKKKKKKQELPTPPDLSKTVDKNFQKVLGDLYANSPKNSSHLSRPPQPQEPKKTSFSSPPKLPGPPRVFSPPPFDQSKSSELPPPPFQDTKPFSGKLPRFEERPSHIFGDEAITDEIQSELRMRSFGSNMLEKTPAASTAPWKSTEDLTRIHFQESRRDYIEAGNKNLELNFFEYAATNYACAILCDLISSGVDKARQTFTQLSTGKPSGVVDNVIFENTQLLIEATRTKNFTFLTRAERAIKSNLSQLYPVRRGDH